MHEGIYAAVGVFYASLVLWLIVAWQGKKQVKDINDFYRPGTEDGQLLLLFRALQRLFPVKTERMERIRKVVVGVSFFAANFAIVGFFFPILLGSAILGLWMLLLPVIFILTYFIFSWFTSHIQETPTYL